MAMGRQRDRQGEMLLSWDELPKSPGHVFYDRLQEVLLENGFDSFVEGLGKPYYAPVMGALGVREAVPDHSWLSKTRGRLPL